MKRLLSAVLSLLLAAGAFALPALAAGSNSDLFRYTVNQDGTVTVTGYEDPDALDIQVPAALGKRRVSAVGDFAFNGLLRLSSVTLPEGLSRLGDYAFVGCVNLNSIRIPDSLVSMGGNPFAASPAQVELSPDHPAFVLRDGGLYDRAGLTLIALPGPERASFTVAEGTQEIGPFAFQERKGLREVHLPGSLLRVGDGAFYGCADLIAVDIPARVTSIGTEAFSRNTSLQRVSLPEGLASLGWRVFGDCPSLTALELPMGLTSLPDDNPFLRTPVALSVPEGHPALAVTDGVLFDKTRRRLVTFPFGDTRQSYTIPEGIVSVGEAAFLGASALREVHFPKGLNSIRLSAFSESGIEEAVLPDSLTILEAWAFTGCESLSSVTLPKRLSQIGEDAFPDGVTLQVVKGSTADRYARQNGIAVKYIKK